MEIEFIYKDGSKAEYSCDSYSFDEQEGFILLSEEDNEGDDQDVAYIRMDEIRSMTIK